MRERGQPRLAGAVAYLDALRQQQFLESWERGVANVMSGANVIEQGNGL